MNRRKFLKMISGLFVLLPFSFGLPIEDKPVIMGVDRAESGNDKTVYNKLFYATNGGDIFCSIDGGASWTEINSGVAGEF